MDRFKDMATFVAVAQSKSFSKASRALGMPLSSLSRRISALEKALGVRLFERNSRALELTEAGVLYYQRCRGLVEAAELAHEELREVAAAPRGHLRVTMSADFGNVFLTPLFAEFARRYPDITFDFDLSPRTVDLVAEHFDVAIRIGAQPDSSLTLRKLAVVQMRLYAAPAYLEAFGTPAHPSDLSEHTTISLSSADVAAGWTLFSGSETHKTKARSRFRLNNVSMMVRLAVLGMGITPTDELFAKPYVASGQLRPVLPAWTLEPVPIYAITPSRILPARTRVFLDCLLQHLEAGTAAVPLLAPASPGARPRLLSRASKDSR